MSIGKGGILILEYGDNYPIIINNRIIFKIPSGLISWTNWVFWEVRRNRYKERSKGPLDIGFKGVLGNGPNFIRGESEAAHLNQNKWVRWYGPGGNLKGWLEILNGGLLNNGSDFRVTITSFGQGGQEKGNSNGLRAEIVKTNNKITDQYVGREQNMSLTGLLSSEADLCVEGDSTNTEVEDYLSYQKYTVDLAFTKRKNKKGKRRKSKRKEDFTVGRIYKWNEFGGGRGLRMGKDDGNADQKEINYWNKRSEWKVYSCWKRIDREVVNEKAGMVILENSEFEEWHELEEEWLGSGQSSYNSSSDNSELDREVLEVEEINIENIVEEAEEAGFEGFRSLMDQHVLEFEDGKNGRPVEPGQSIQSNGMSDKGLSKTQYVRMDGQQTIVGEKVEGRVEVGQVVRSFLPEESRSVINIGKVGITWEEIQVAMGALNLEIIEKEPRKDITMGEVKEGRSTASRRKGERELNNLKSSINYEKGRKDKGIVGVK